MTINRKRSVSPNTENSYAKNNFDDPKKSTLSSYFTKFKQSFLSPSPTSERINNESQQQQQIVSNDFNIEDDSLTNFKPSDKRRRLSIQGHPSPQEIPRSSVAYSAQFLPRQRSYLIIYNGVKTNEEELNNDLEVRVTAKESQDSIDDRDESPFVGLPPAPHSDVILGCGGNDISDDEEQEEQAQFQEVIEYAPLYQDESGNIVRPPFINLDPRERYQLLQLKRSIETSEALQNRIKYMVNPNETHSRKIRGTNKVETSTQTHDINYLNSTLNFKRKLEPLNSIHDRPVKKQKRRGFSMEPFEYDIKTIEPVVSTTSLTGVLGNVSKPKFKDSTAIEDNKITHIIPREDEEPILKKFAQKSASGNRDLFGRQDTSNLKLDDNYIKQSDSISDIIKVKDNLDNSKTTKKNTVGPSSGFKFNINKDDFKEVIDARRENDKMFNSSKAVNTALFGQKSDDKNEKEELATKDSKPLFLFGEPKKLEQSSLFNKTDSDKKEAPKFSFGGQPTQSKEAPKFTFGKTITPEEPKESIDSGKERLEELKKPSLFSFGKTEEKKPTVDSAKVGLFGNKKESESSKPQFSFGTKKDTENAPVFSFGGKKESTPASLDDNNDTPSLSISKKEEDKPKQNETKPLFGFSGATSKDSTPSTPNTTSSTPFTFGGPQKDEKKEELVKSGLFSFNQNSAGTGTLVASTFKFGGSTEDKPQKRQYDNDDEEAEKKDKDEEQQSITKKVNFNAPASTTPTTTTTPQPILFSFGSATSNSHSKPAFQLGTNITENKASAPGAASVATSTPVPPTTATSAPSAGAFSFGAAITKPAPPPTTGNPSFKFAAGITPPTGTKPLFNFGATTVPTPTPAPAPVAVAGAVAGAVPATSSTPNFSGLGQTSAFGGASASPAFGQPNITGGAFGNAAPASVFGQPSGNTFGQTSNMFGNKLAVSIASAPTNNAFGSRPTTPTFNFGATTNPAVNSNPVLPAPLPNAVPLFNFTGSKESTPDPASIFGQHNGNRSASGTPFGGSMNNNMFGQQQQQQQQLNMFGAGTNSTNGSFGFGGGANSGGPVVNGGVPTPVVNPRRIIQPRSRRR